MVTLALVLLGACRDPLPSTAEVPTPPTTSVDEVLVARVDRPDSFVVGPGGWSIVTGEELFDVGLAFYDTYGDDYDFLIVYTEEEVSDLFAFTIPLGHDIEGIGLQEVMALYGWTDLDAGSAGSAGRLQAIVLMNAPSVHANSALWGPQDILTHEVTHRWGANLSLGVTSDPWVLVDGFWSHWNVHAAVGGDSALGYGAVVDEGGGRFRFDLADALVNSDLELYQMGLLAADEVGELFVVDEATDQTPATPFDGAWDNDDYAQSVSYAGTRVDFTMADVVEHHGPRVPDASDAQTDFRFAFVLVCEGECDADALSFAVDQQQTWPATFDVATRSLASADATLE